MIFSTCTGISGIWALVRQSCIHKYIYEDMWNTLNEELDSVHEILNSMDVYVIQ